MADVVAIGEADRGADLHHAHARHELAIDLIDDGGPRLSTGSGNGGICIHDGVCERTAFTVDHANVQIGGPDREGRDRRSRERRRKPSPELADLTLRASEANQLGLLGFGGDLGGYHALAEGSLGAFVTDEIILGAEYRQKPNDLSSFRENDFKDLFLTYFPVKSLSVTAALADLGNIADKRGQSGYYLSLQGSW